MIAQYRQLRTRLPSLPLAGGLDSPTSDVGSARLDESRLTMSISPGDATPNQVTMYPVNTYIYIY